MDLSNTVRALMKDGRGILAADEDVSALENRFAAFDIPCTKDSRARYRELLLATPGIESFLSAVIFSEEGIRQSASSGTLFPEFIAAKGILSGVRLDEDAPEDLEARLQEYKSLAITFAKKRIVLAAEDTSSDDALKARADELARFATLCQEKGLVPIIGLELIQKSPHTALQAEEALTAHLSVITKSLQVAKADDKGLIVETSMTTTGSENPLPAEPAEVAERTLRALSAAIPSDVGGVVFFSDGEIPEAATASLNAIARLEPFPWPVAFCFSHALQEPVLRVWQGNDENVADAQAAFHGRLSLNVRADGAGYGKGMESA